MATKRFSNKKEARKAVWDSLQSNGWLAFRFLLMDEFRTSPAPKRRRTVYSNSNPGSMPRDSRSIPMRLNDRFEKKRCGAGFESMCRRLAYAAALCCSIRRQSRRIR